MFTEQGRTSAARIILAFRWLREHPEGKINTGIWTDPVWDADAFRRWFAKCLADKINSHDKREGRKHTADYQRDLSIDGYQIRQYQQGIRQSGSSGLLRTPEMRARFPHINRQPWRD